MSNKFYNSSRVRPRRSKLSERPERNRVCICQNCVSSEVVELGGFLALCFYRPSFFPFRSAVRQFVESFHQALRKFHGQSNHHEPCIVCHYRVWRRVCAISQQQRDCCSCARPCGHEQRCGSCRDHLWRRRSSVQCRVCYAERRLL